MGQAAGDSVSIPVCGVSVHSRPKSRAGSFRLTPATSEAVGVGWVEPDAPDCELGRREARCVG